MRLRREYADHCDDVVEEFEDVKPSPSRGKRAAKCHSRRGCEIFAFFVAELQRAVGSITDG